MSSNIGIADTTSFCLAKAAKSPPIAAMLALDMDAQLPLQ
jgi:hypothetical protein